MREETAIDNTQAKERARAAIIQMAKVMHKMVDAFRDLLLAWLDLRPDPPRVARMAEDEKAISSIAISARAVSALIYGGVHTVGDFKRLTVEDIRALKNRANNCGDVTVRELLAVREELKTMPEGRGLADENRCPKCGSINLRDKGGFDKCMDCGERIS